MHMQTKYFKDLMNKPENINPIFRFVLKNKNKFDHQYLLNISKINNNNIYSFTIFEWILF